MSTTDLETIHGLAPVINELPGEPVPYYLASGEGKRHERDGQLYTVIARGADTGGIFDAAFILGPRGAFTSARALPSAQRSYFVVAGSAQFWLPGQSRVLVAGDSIHVPEGVEVAYRMLSHMTKLLLFSAPCGAVEALVADESEVPRHVYSAQGGSSGKLVLPGRLEADDRLWLAGNDIWDDQLPSGQKEYFLRAGAGEHRAWPDALNTYVARGRNTAGRYFAVDTLAAPQPYIIRHFHKQHTENFLCLSGRVWLWVNGHEVLLTPGDFLHAPAGTIHSFAIAAHNTQMLGLLTSDVFEPFFDVTGVATDDLVHTEGLINPSVVMGGIKGNPDLDLVVVGPPPERARATGI